MVEPTKMIEGMHCQVSYIKLMISPFMFPLPPHYGWHISMIYQIQYARIILNPHFQWFLIVKLSIWWQIPFFHGPLNFHSNHSPLSTLNHPFLVGRLGLLLWGDRLHICVPLGGSLPHGGTTIVTMMMGENDGDKWEKWGKIGNFRRFMEEKSLTWLKHRKLMI